MAAFLQILVTVSIIALMIYSIILHEIGHALVAYKLGDDTGARQGRLTLNPAAHIDPFQTIIMPIISYVAFGFAFGGARPVPIVAVRFRKPELGLLLCTIAGPLTNITLSIVFGLLYRALAMTGGFVSEHIMTVLLSVGFLNFYLAAFNLIPIPPLDGSRVLRYFLPRDLQRNMDLLEPYGFMILLGFLLVMQRTGLWWSVSEQLRYAYSFISG